jgi:hypothetical protein
MQLAVHLQLGEADIHAVEIGDEIAQEQQRNESPRDFGEDGGFKLLKASRMFA